MKKKASTVSPKNSANLKVTRVIFHEIKKEAWTTGLKNSENLKATRVFSMK